ncbi:AarF/ABC1/UbiB kinase family protein [Alcanivorax sp. DP30]|uniref:ABC1 kinase family protein n=1 Tax=Alcanivorax sp. DP30 TaxID=2606217 RepID=UPI00136F5511|nr:AarF/UbiB family protein [Alcanivorax sp. DP30]MZR61869.1 AarF/ABC1/UbiB kinase family protein [Alcanivorax sp. DP30]
MIKEGVVGLSGIAAGRTRYLRAMAALSQLVAVYAAGGLGDKSESHRRGAEILTRLCRRNGGFWVKAAQFFSCRPDVLPREYIEAFQQLQNDAHPVPFSAVEKVFSRSWGKDWRDQFLWVQEVPVAVASIAQVHRARLKDGQDVAIKVRLPKVKKLFEQDAKVFRAVAAVVAPRFREFDLRQAIEQLLSMTAIELDFRNEAANMLRFSRQPHHPRIRIPELIKPLCNERILVTSWEGETRLRDYLDDHRDKAADLLGVLLTSYLQQVTRFGIYQADPHPGNFLVNDAGQVVILDFGAIGILTPDEVRRYSRLLYGLMGFEGQVDIGELFVQAGFKGGSPETLEALALFVLTDQMRKQGPVAAMGELMERFREERISIPDSYIGISRVLITLGGFLMSYEVPFDWTPPEQRKVAAAEASVEG